jgi:hypothetical protein
MSWADKLDTKVCNMCVAGRACVLLNLVRDGFATGCEELSTGLPTWCSESKSFDTLTEQLVVRHHPKDLFVSRYELVVERY